MPTFSERMSPILEFSCNRGPTHAFTIGVQFLNSFRVRPDSRRASMLTAPCSHLPNARLDALSKILALEPTSVISIEKLSI